MGSSNSHVPCFSVLDLCKRASHAVETAVGYAGKGERRSEAADTLVMLSCALSSLPSALVVNPV